MFLILFGEFPECCEFHLITKQPKCVFFFSPGLIQKEIPPLHLWACLSASQSYCALGERTIPIVAGAAQGHRCNSSRLGGEGAQLAVHE
jgi:hypothetical protein